MTSRTCFSIDRTQPQLDGRGYETYGNGTAETLTHTLGADETTVDWYRPVAPPTGSFRWSARDNVNYMETRRWRHWTMSHRSPRPCSRISI